MSKKTFYIIFACGIGILVLFLLLFLWGGRDVPPEDTETGNGLGGTQNGEGSGNLFGPGGTNGENGLGPGVTGNGPNGELIRNELNTGLYEITDVPVAGHVFLERGDWPFIRYIERATGHIYEVDLRETRSVRVSGRTVPRIHDAYWGASGEYVIIRYLDTDDRTIKSFLVDLSRYTEFEDYQFDGIFLEDNITDISIVPETDTAVLVIDTAEGSSIQVLDMAEREITPVHNSLFSEWLVQAVSPTEVFLTTKPSQEVPGYLYKLRTDTGEFTRIFGDVDGLTTLTSPDGVLVLYSESTRGSFRTHIYHTMTGNSFTVPINTLPEKCAWVSNSALYCGMPKRIPTGTHPDSWYKGTIQFADQIFHYDISSGNYELLTDPIQDGGKEIDVTFPNTLNGTVFLMTNKRDSHLWAYLNEI